VCVCACMCVGVYMCVYVYVCVYPSPVIKTAHMPANARVNASTKHE